MTNSKTCKQMRVLTDRMKNKDGFCLQIILYNLVDFTTTKEKWCNGNPLQTSYSEECLPSSKLISHVLHTVKTKLCLT